MKVAFLILIAFAVTLVSALVVRYRWVHPHLLPCTTAVELRNGAGAPVMLPRSDSETFARNWIDSHQTGWRVSFVTYAPQRTLSCDTFNINLGDHSLVLNYARPPKRSFVEVVRDLTPDEELFWRSTLKTPGE